MTNHILYTFISNILQDDEPEQKQERVSFTVKFVKFDPAKKVAVIKEIKNQLSDMNLVQVL